MEEGARQARAVELMEQARRVDRHVRDMLRKLTDQDARLEAAIAAARATLHKSVGKLASAEAALFGVLSTPSLEIKQRETADVKAHVLREISKVLLSPGH